MGKIYAVPLLIAITLVGAVYALNFSPPKTGETVFETVTPSEEGWLRLDEKTPVDENTIKVYITGAVEAAGVYEVKEDSRVVDVLEAAGGATEDADLESVNLSSRIYDEDHIRIKRIGETAEEAEQAEQEEKTAVQATVKVSAPKVQESPLININTATAAQLETLPNVGTVTAQKIITYREQAGGFNTIEDIMKVDRIGTKTFEAMKDLITVGN